MVNGQSLLWICRVHVDAAYAGAAAVLPSMRHWFRGVDLTDSFSFNPHKWLLTNFDCAALWVSDCAPLKAALSLTPTFLQAKGNAVDYKVPALPCPCPCSCPCPCPCPFLYLSSPSLLDLAPDCCFLDVFLERLS